MNFFLSSRMNFRFKRMNYGDLHEWPVQVWTVFIWLRIGKHSITRNFSTIWPNRHVTSYRCVCGNLLQTCHPPVWATRVHWISLVTVWARRGGWARIDQTCDLKSSYIYPVQVSLPWSETIRKASTWAVLRRRKYVIRYQIIALQYIRFICQTSFKQVPWQEVMPQKDREAGRKQFCEFNYVFYM